MRKVTIRKTTQADRKNFITAVLQSHFLHFPWVSPPSTPEEYDLFLARYSDVYALSFLVLDQNAIAGVLALEY